MSQADIEQAYADADKEVAIIIRTVEVVVDVEEKEIDGINK